MSENTDRSYPIWDLPTRLFHWSIVALVAAQWATGEYGWLDLGWHFRFGYALLTLVVFRIAWGLVGSGSARFADFLAGPRRIRDYLRSLNDSPKRATIGHNPLGGWSVLAMLLSLAVQAGTGLFINDDIEWLAPLNGRVSAKVAKFLLEVHETNANVLVALILLHLAAIYYHVRVRGEDLLRPMFSGRKTLAIDPGLRFASPWLALALVLVIAVAVWRLVLWGEAG